MEKAIFKEIMLIFVFLNQTPDMLPKKEENYRKKKEFELIIFHVVVLLGTSE